jgi:hypothetical protein
MRTQGNAVFVRGASPVTLSRPALASPLAGQRRPGAQAGFGPNLEEIGADAGARRCREHEVTQAQF